MALMLVATFAATPAYAAAKKTVKKQGFTTSLAKVKKKAAKVKRGTTSLTIKKGKGWLKFKAPKTKTYTFTFSDVKSAEFSSNAFVGVYKVAKYSSSSVASVKVKTKGGKSNTLWLSCNGYAHANEMLERPIAKRSGKIKLAKGEWVYLYFYNNDVKTTANLTIK